MKNLQTTYTCYKTAYFKENYQIKKFSDFYFSGGL